MVLSAQHKQAQLVGIDVERDALEIPVLVFMQWTDEDVGVFLLIARAVVQPLIHQAVR